jgi:hypothetical protein
MNKTISMIKIEWNQLILQKTISYEITQDMIDRQDLSIDWIKGAIKEFRSYIDSKEDELSLIKYIKDRTPEALN